MVKDIKAQLEKVIEKIELQTIVLKALNSSLGKTKINETLDDLSRIMRRFSDEMGELHKVRSELIKIKHSTKI